MRRLPRTSAPVLNSEVRGAAIEAIRVVSGRFTIAVRIGLIAQSYGTAT